MNLLDYVRIDTRDLPPVRRLIEERGYNISGDTLQFIKNVENQAYPEEMKMMQDIEDIKGLENAHAYTIPKLTVARNIDWYIIYSEAADSIKIVDIASLPNRDRSASRQEMHNYMTRVINQKAYNDGKYVTLNAKEDTSYRMILRMVANGEYKIDQDIPNDWNDNENIKMHYLTLEPIISNNGDYNENIKIHNLEGDDR